MFFQIFCYRKYHLDKFVIFFKEKLNTYMYYLSNYATAF